MLIQFDFGVIHRQELYHQTTDAISRLPENGDGSLHDEEDVSNNVLPYRRMRRNTAACLTVDDNHSVPLTVPTL